MCRVHRVLFDISAERISVVDGRAVLFPAAKITQLVAFGSAVCMAWALLGLFFPEVAVFLTFDRIGIEGIFWALNTYSGRAGLESVDLL